MCVQVLVYTTLWQTSVSGFKVWKCGQSGGFPSTLYRVNEQNVKVGIVLSGPGSSSEPLRFHQAAGKYLTSLLRALLQLYEIRHKSHKNHLYSLKLEGPTTVNHQICSEHFQKREQAPQRWPRGGGVFRLNTLQPVVGQLRPGSPGVQVSHFMTDITTIKTKHLNDKCSNREFFHSFISGSA